jgi:hypothetical protein
MHAATLFDPYMHAATLFDPYLHAVTLLYCLCALRVLQATLTATAVASGKSAESAKSLFRGSVLQSKPWFLEDLAGVQRKGLEVLPEGLLDHSKPLTGPQLEVLLVQYFTGSTPEQQQQQQQQQQQEQQGGVAAQNEATQQQQQALSAMQCAVADVSPADATAPTKADSSSSSGFQQQRQQQRSTQTGFRPVSTDLLVFDLDSATAGGGSLLSQPSESTESALRDLMAAGAAAVPISMTPVSSSSRSDSSIGRSSEKLSIYGSGNTDSGTMAVPAEAAAGADVGVSAAAVQDAVIAPPVHAAVDASSGLQRAAAVQVAAAEVGTAATQPAASAVADASDMQLQDDYYGDYEEHLDDIDLDADALLIEYQQLKQQQQQQEGSGLQDLEAAYQRIQAEGMASGQSLPQDISPTAIAAAAAEAGVGVDDGELTDAIAAKFFAGPRPAGPNSSTAGTAKPSSRTGSSSGTTRTSRRPVQQQRQSEVLSSMQLQLQQLQQQAQAVLQQQQQPGAGGNTKDSQLQSFMQGGWITNWNAAAAVTHCNLMTGSVMYHCVLSLAKHDPRCTLFLHFALCNPVCCAAWQ